MTDCWRQFLVQTTVHGFVYLNSKRKRVKYVWIFIILFPFVLCLWKSANDVKDYTDFNILTTTVHSKARGIPFPAITIYNSNAARRKIIGRFTQTQYLLAGQLGVDLKKVNFSQIMACWLFYKPVFITVLLKVRKTCNYQPKSNEGIDFNVESVVEFFIKALNFTSFDQTMVDFILTYAVVNREMTFVNCWIQGKQVNCQHIVLNTVLQDFGNRLVPSYSINLDKNQMEIFRSKETLGISFRFFLLFSNPCLIYCEQR